MQGVAVHWEAGVPREDHARCAAQVEEIRRFHIAKGYSDIAYNMLACQHGGVFTGRGWGRPSGANGTTWSNLNIWAVCFMSGPGYPFTAAGQAALGSLVEEALRRSSSPRSVEPHSTYFNTACPGDAIRAWINAGHGGGTAPAPDEEDDEVPALIVNVIGGGKQAWLLRDLTKRPVYTKAQLDYLVGSGQAKLVEKPVDRAFFDSLTEVK